MKKKKKNERCWRNYCTFNNKQPIPFTLPSYDWRYTLLKGSRAIAIPHITTYPACLPANLAWRHWTQAYFTDRGSLLFSLPLSCRLDTQTTTSPFCIVTDKHINKQTNKHKTSSRYHYRLLSCLGASFTSLPVLFLPPCLCSLVFIFLCFCSLSWPAFVYSYPFLIPLDSHPPHQFNSFSLSLSLSLSLAFAFCMPTFNNNNSLNNQPFPFTLPSPFLPDTLILRTVGSVLSSHSPHSSTSNHISSFPCTYFLHPLFLVFFFRPHSSQPSSYSTAPASQKPAKKNH